MPCSNLRFLVIEDNDFQRAMLVRMLTTLGATGIEQAADGASGLAVLVDPARPVDIVISDLAMPGMDGLEFIRRLGESCNRVSLAVVSAVDRPLLASVANMARAYKVNLLGAIGKPATAVKLVPLVEKHRTGKMPSARPGEIRFSADEIAQAWKRHEFAPWFEPVVRMVTGATSAMSSVPHWRHPELGMLPAEAFMASIRARGLQDSMTWLMLRKSAACCSAWQRQGPGVPVSVNLGFASLTGNDLAREVELATAAANLDARMMSLTLTEETLHTELPHALENLARLRVHGFGLCLDDFGSGPMASEQLALVAFTQLKIKSSFVTGAGHGEADLAGVASGLDFCSRLRIDSVAAGIDTQDKWDLLLSWDCTHAQGAHIAPPMEAGAVPLWLAVRAAP